MSKAKSEQGETLIPNLVYADADAAIAWLDKAFGFSCQLRVEGEAGAIAHAQLVNGMHMIMLSSVRRDEFGKHFDEPNNLTYATQGIYVVVPHVGDAYEKALAAGAQIVMPLQSQDYGGEGFTVRDCGGHIWSFGDYNPWDG